MQVETAAEQFLFLTVRVDLYNSIGTGFFFCHKWVDINTSKELTGIFLVTNKHVVSGADQARLTITRGHDKETPALGNMVTVELKQEHWGLWFYHPDEDVDIAVFPMNPVLNSLEDSDGELFIRYIGTDHLPNKETLESLDAIEEVLFVGYPNNIYDRQHNLPIFRRGITASHPNIDYEDKPYFLIDASVFPGSSGSPVFIYSSSGGRKGGLMIGDKRTVFLGILASVLYIENDGSLEFREIPTSVEATIRTREMLDLGVVYKARTVQEAIEFELRRRGQIV